MSRHIKPTHFVCLLSSLVLFGAVQSFAVGTAADEFLNLFPDPTVAAVGGGAFAQASDMPGTALNNPASLSGITRPRLSLNYIALPGDISYNSFSLALPTAYGCLGASVLYADYGFVKGYDNNGNSISDQYSSDVGAVLSYAMPLQRSIPVHREYGAIGANLKFLHGMLSQYSAEAVALDVGGIFRVPFVDGVTAGVTYRNLGSSVKYNTRSYDLPASLDFGLRFAFPELWDLALLGDCSMPVKGRTIYSTGISISPVYFMVLRAGWRQQTGLPEGANFLSEGFTGGIGLRFGGLMLDYAFTPANYFSPTHYLGVNLAVGSILKLDTASDYYLNEHFYQACAAYSKKDYISARKQFEDILSIYPDHRPSQKYLEKIMAAIDEQEQQQEQRVTRWLKKAESAMLKKDYITAGKFYNQVLAVDPENSTALGGREDISQLVAAVRQEKIRQKNMALINRLWNSAVNHYVKGDFVKAKEEFSEILNIDPDHQEAKKYIVEIDNQLTKVATSRINELYAQGTEFYRQGNYREAMKYFEAVVIAAPHRLDAQDFVQKCQENMDNLAEKTKTERLRKDQERMRDEMSSVYDRALRYYEKGHYEAALEDFQKSEEIAGKYEFKEYLDDTRRYLELIKSSLSDKYYKIGFDNFRQNKFEPAVEAYRRALQYNPDNTSAKVELGRIAGDVAQRYFEEGMTYYSRNDREKAREMFKKSLYYEPDKVESQRALERMK
jgi:tetratricopeptide (TPR) repeat protein